MSELCVKIKETDKSYPLYIESSEISELVRKLKPYTSDRKVFVVISEKVNKLYGKTLNIPAVDTFVLKDGEKEKNFNNYKKILHRMLKNKLSRKDLLLVIGGGVAGDLAGFAASTYMRGIDFIQIPTTLLACVDSSVGGKVGIDTDFGKNLVGAFYQPKAVFININFLKTLDEKQFKTGLGEVVKYSFIEKSCKPKEEINLFNFLSDNFEKINNRDTRTLEKLVQCCVGLKIAVVEQDEKEGGLRKILNFGHTYGHAVEKITNYRKYTHGEAVVEGMRFAFNLAVEKGLIEKNYKFLADDIINKFNFTPVKTFNMNQITEIMKTDKKASNGKITFVLPTEYQEVKTFDFDEDFFLNYNYQQKTM